MNFEALNWLVNSILNWFSCWNCWWKAKKENLNIKSIDQNSAVIEIICEKCWKDTVIKSEVMAVDLTKFLTNEQIKEVKQSFLKKWLENISDEEIEKLWKDLKKTKINAKDLFE